MEASQYAHSNGTKMVDVKVVNEADHRNGTLTQQHQHADQSGKGQNGHAKGTPVSTLSNPSSPREHRGRILNPLEWVHRMSGGGTKGQHKTVVNRETVPHEDHHQMAPEALHAITSDHLSPPEFYKKLRDNGKAKVTKPHIQTLIHTILAGWYIGWGSFLALYLSGNMGIAANAPWYGVVRIVYGCVFSVGLIYIIMLGSELWTGNTLVCTLAWLEGDVAAWRYWLNIVFAWFGNLVGAMILVQLIVASNMLHDYPLFASMSLKNAEKKVLHLTFEQVYVRALLGNWMVTLAVMLSSASTTYVGKVLGIFLPIFTFASLGLEHAIANMTLIPVGMYAGADVTVRTFISRNLIAATLGNFTGGACFMGVPYFLLYGRWSAKLNQWTKF